MRKLALVVFSIFLLSVFSFFVVAGPTDVWGKCEYATLWKTAKELKTGSTLDARCCYKDNYFWQSGTSPCPGEDFNNPASVTCGGVHSKYISPQSLSSQSQNIYFRLNLPSANPVRFGTVIQAGSGADYDPKTDWDNDCISITSNSCTSNGGDTNDWCPQQPSPPNYQSLSSGNYCFRSIHFNNNEGFYRPVVECPGGPTTSTTTTRPTTIPITSTSTPTTVGIDCDNNQNACLNDNVNCPDKTPGDEGKGFGDVLFDGEGTFGTRKCSGDDPGEWFLANRHLQRAINENEFGASPGTRFASCDQNTDCVTVNVPSLCWNQGLLDDPSWICSNNLWDRCDSDDVCDTVNIGTTVYYCDGRVWTTSNPGCATPTSTSTSTTTTPTPPPLVPPACTLTAASIANCAGGTCEPGETVSMSATFTGACTTDINKHLQIDAKSTDGICKIEFTGGDMSGITKVNPAISGTTYSGGWLVPAIPADCVGKTAHAWAAAIWNGAPGSPGSTQIASRVDATPTDSSPVGGSVVFASSAATNLNVITQKCVDGSFLWGKRGAETTFSWTKGTGAIDAQWLDISTNSDIAARNAGNFLSANNPPSTADAAYVSKIGNAIGPLLPGTSHWWRINTRFGSEWKPSAWSAFNTIACPSLTPPFLISPPSGATGVCTTPTFTWSSVPGAAAYWIFITRDIPFDIVVSTSTPTNSYTIPLAAGTGYHWRVYACVNPGCSPTSADDSSLSALWPFTTGATSCAPTPTPPPAPPPTPTACTLTSASIINCVGGTCETGEIVNMSASFTGSCTTGSNTFFQIDAKTADGVCDIQFSRGDMEGITQQNPAISGTTYSGGWLVPSRPADCVGKTAHAWAAAIWNGAPGTGTKITGVVDSTPTATTPVAGSLVFSPPPPPPTPGTSTVSGKVWVDTNHNGIMDSGELGYSGITVRVSRGLRDDVVAEITTDASGNYALSLSAGSYSISVIPDKATSRYGGTTPHPVLITLPPSTTVDFGISPTSIVGGKVWVDTNADGIMDSGESGYSGAAVSASPASGVYISSNPIITDASGKYAFVLWEYEANYIINLLVPAGYTTTTTNPVGATIPPSKAANFGIKPLTTPTPPPAPPPTPTACTLTSASIINCVGGTCETGESVIMSASFTGSCTTGSNTFFQIDAKTADGVCDIQFSRGDMEGITQQNPAISGTTYSGGWLVPAIPADCVGKTAHAWAAAIWNGAPGSGTQITSKVDAAPTDASPVGGSLVFAPTSTSTSTSTTSTSTSTSTSTTPPPPPTPPGSNTINVNGAVWNDANKNGIKEAGETDVSGLSIKIVGAPCTSPPLGYVATTTTGAVQNNYEFLNAPLPDACDLGVGPGSAGYVLILTLPPGYTYWGGLLCNMGSSSPGATISASCAWVAIKRNTYTFNFGVEVPTPCVHANPAVTITPASKGGTAGSSLTYDVGVKNNDASCPAETYSLSASGTACTSPWSCSLVPSLTVSSGSSASAAITVTSPTSASPSSNTFSVAASAPGHSGTGSATYVVSDFTVAATPTIFVTKPQSGSRDRTGTITVGSVNSFSSAVALSGSWFDTSNNPISAPAGVTINYAPASVTPPSDSQATSTLTITAQSTATTGTFILRTTGTSSKSHSADTKVIISSFGLEFEPKSTTKTVVDFVWGAAADEDKKIKVRDKSELPGSPQIKYTISSKTRIGACDAANTDVFDSDGNVVTEFRIQKGAEKTSPFRIRAKATDDSFCTFSFKIFAPDGAEVDPSFTVDPQGPAPPAVPAGMNIKVTYPFVEKKLIPLVKLQDGRLAPDFTKSMPISFLVTAKSLDLLPVDCRFDNCIVQYKIKEKDAFFSTCPGNEFKPNQCIAFDKFTPIGPAWKAERPSKDPFNGLIDLSCDTDYTLVIKADITSGPGVGSSGTLETPIHINCKPRITVDPPERPVVLGQKNIDAFAVTIWDPEPRTYALEMRNAKPEHAFLVGAGRWVEFVCPPSVTCSADKLRLENIQSGQGVSFVVRLTADAATKVGNFPIRFSASSPSITPTTADATIKVFAEGLNEFALWQLAVLVLISAAVISVMQPSRRTRYN